MIVFNTRKQAHKEFKKLCQEVRPDTKESIKEARAFIAHKDGKCVIETYYLN